MEKVIMKKQIKLKSLNISFIKKDFIDGFKTNYEEYLIEFVNSSKLVTDNGNKKFRIINEQANGECDIKNGEYMLDFKVLLDSKTAENMSYYSDSVTVNKTTGIRIYGSGKKTGEWKKYYFINILKGLTKKDFEDIDSSPKSELNEFKKLVKDYIKNIKKDKNIMYFIPYNIYFENEDMDIEKLELIVQQLRDGLKGFMEYRTARTKKDTYFAFISNNNIIFLKYYKELKIYDVIPTEKSELYSKIDDICDIWGTKI